MPLVDNTAVVKMMSVIAHKWYRGQSASAVVYPDSSGTSLLTAYQQTPDDYCQMTYTQTVTSHM